MPPLELTEESVMKQLALLDVNKSAGPDGLHPCLLHECRTEIVYPLSKLIRLSLDSSKLPAEWKVAYITPIHKKGRKDSVENYRPISITSVVVKLLEHIVNKAVIEHLDWNHRLNSSQHGFQCNRSVDTNLLESYEYITKLLELRIPVDMIFLDFSKAFDKVCHRRVELKLQSIGLEEKILKWILDFLRKCVQHVRLFDADGNPILSSSQNVISGVPQGSVLGPTMFNIFINDAPLALKSRMTLYADDSKVIGPASTLEDTSQLQNDLDLLSVWAKSWLLTFNVSKCHVLHFGHKNINTTYSLYGQLLSPVLEERDLGVIVDNDLKFSTHAKKAAASASSSLGLIKRTISSRSPKILSFLYKGLVRPRLETGMVLASPFFKKDVKILEDVQLPT